ncbi:MULTISPECIES: ABC transporter ATP-binding protein [Cryobacterium]|uniref:ABC transporter ATP-binding protein n=1 Tax=Cryobacterium TaxID=69578 RepID=UPI001F545E1E|nr:MULTISPECIES: ATP-binding cassette domain-containing protein [Cryobacterium]MDY7529608.1 ATP-binding cassette domain-containing protein [Cryobacterium sp. 10C2]MDY7558248.1 ATP-binding cassette domain-containing protein [Cryobacterium sp. 10C3]MEB0200798.1 ATP-binding cassette domain-containing protein [Cryobacterium sp. 5I3]MEB0291948.1 ATP-binding cassette domain-containing protein [Cryobacterium sp. 10C2]
MSPAIASVELAIETHGLTKQFGRQAAVAGIDLAVPTGSVFGFLGPNGSGKTTTIRMLLGLASATSGEISLLGRSMPGSLRSVLPRVGALVEGPAFYPFLSGTANLRRLDTADPGASAATRAARVQHALERVGLTHAAGKKVHAYSLGMKQRLGIANALLMPRELLVLDEPTNGLDPQGTREVRSLVRSLAAEGTTVFVSSHLLAEVEQMCSHVAVMRAGTLVAQGTLDELRGAGEAHARLDTPDPVAARQVLERLGLTPVTLVSAAGAPGHLSAALTAAAPAPEDIVAALVAAGVRVRGFTVAAASLEERFVALTGEGFDVAQ